MNIIHPTAIISSSVILGENNYIGPYCYINSKVILGNNNRLEAFCSIWTPPEYWEYMKWDIPYKSVIIWDNNTFREGVIITGWTENNTTIWDNVVLLSKVSVAHDVIIENNVICSSGVCIAGYVHIMTGAILWLGVLCHQKVIIGAYSMLWMGTIVTKKTNIEPWKVYIWSPAKYLKDNTIGLERAAITANILKEAVERFLLLWI